IAFSGRPHPAASDARLAEPEKPRFRIRHGHVQRGADRDRLRTLLSWIGNGPALDELDPHCRRLFRGALASRSYFFGQAGDAVTRLTATATGLMSKHQAQLKALLEEALG
ncbi:hypothetical protein B4Q13_20855, partial [Lacticaseibacillus rhamnosus]